MLEPTRSPRWSLQALCVRFAIDVPSPSTASSVPTAKAICRIVARLRRLRRATLRTPIWNVGGRNADAAQQPGRARVGPPDLGAGRLERLADRHAHAAADRRQRREHRAEQADEDARGEHRPVDGEPAAMP